MWELSFRSEFENPCSCANLFAFSDSLPVLVLHEAKESLHAPSLVFWLRLLPQSCRRWQHHGAREAQRTLASEASSQTAWLPVEFIPVQKQMEPEPFTLKSHPLQHQMKYSFNIQIILLECLLCCMPTGKTMSISTWNLLAQISERSCSALDMMARWIQLICQVYLPKALLLLGRVWASLKVPLCRVDDLLFIWRKLVKCSLKVFMLQWIERNLLQFVFFNT